MESIQELINNSVNGGFWHFIGYWIITALIFGIPAKTIAYIIQIIARHKTIREVGYPPNHCDADGDFNKYEESEQIKIKNYEK